MEYGKLMFSELKGNKVMLVYEKQLVVVEVIRDDIINFFVPVWSMEHRSKAIEGDKYQFSEFYMKEVEDGVIIRTQKVMVKAMNDFYVEIYDSTGELLLADKAEGREKRVVVSDETIAILQAEGHDVSGLAKGEGKIQLVKKLTPDMHFYGLGDKSGFLNKREYEYENWNSDLPQAHNEDFHALYKSIPFLICHKKEHSFGLFFDNTFRSHLNLGKEDPGYFFYEAEDGNLDYYFIAGPRMTDVVSGYTYLTGTTPLPQLWTLGYQQCRWGYECAEDIREVALKYRELQIPCESVQYDIDYMDGYRVFTWNEKDYGKPGELFEELGALGYKPVVIIDPGVKVDKDYSMYKEGIRRGYFAQDTDGKTYVNEVWPGDSVFPDFGRQSVRLWWGEAHKFLTDMGVRGVWNDMNEPASFRGPLPGDVVFYDEDRQTTHDEIHNVYGHFMSKATYEGLRDLTEYRPFVITRACYAGSQKYACVWTGDNQSLWAHLQMLVPQLCNLGLSGFALAGTDIGGFGADATPELLCRWIEAAVFSPFFRNHAAKGTRRQEPWQFGDEVVDIYRKYVNLRYQFLPYIYDLFYEGTTTGLPIMRPLVLHYDSDPETFNLNSEFLVGEWLLVAPILEQGATRRLVYLPAGGWYNYWTGEKYKGKQYIMVEAGIDELPLFVKAGAVIPMYDVRQYVGEAPYDKLTLLVTPEPGKTTHYVDDGETFACEDGAYTLYQFFHEKGKVRTRLLHNGYKEYETIAVRRVVDGCK